MYSEDYNDEDDELEDFQNENFIVTFYRNNKVLVWILLGVILFIIIMSLLTKGGSNTSKSTSTYDVKIEPSGDAIISIGNSQLLLASVDGDDSPTIKWSIKDSSIASVDEGVVRAINYGVTTVTATYVDKDKNSHTDDKTIIVGDGSKDVKLTGVEFKNGDLFMPVDSIYTISLILTPSNAFVENKTFTSSNTSIVTVDDKGEVKAISPGEAIVSYNVNNGAFKGDLKVFVDSDYAYAEIISTPQSISLDGELRKIKVGESSKLTYTVNPTNASRSRFTWSSSNTSVAKVDDLGNIEGVKEGSAVITVTAINGVSDKIDVEVEKNTVDVTDITLGVSDISMILGETKEITPIVTPDSASNKSLSFSSSNESVAIVVANSVGTSGKIYALNSGKTLIRVKSSNGIEKSFTVTVTGQSAKVNPTTAPSTSNNSGYNGGSYNNSSSNNSVSKDTSINVYSSPNYVYNYMSDAKNNSAPGDVSVNVKLGNGVAYVKYGTAKNGASCTPSKQKSSSFGLNIPKGGIFEICISKYDSNNKLISSGSGNYFSNAFHYYVNTGYVATPTPKPTSTPRPTYSCNLSFDKSSKVLTMTGSSSDGSGIIKKSITIDGRETTMATVSGVYTGVIYFDNGGSCTKALKITIATPAPTANTCSISNCSSYSCKTNSCCKCSKCASGYEVSGTGTSCIKKATNSGTNTQSTSPIISKAYPFNPYTNLGTTNPTSTNRAVAWYSRWGYYLGMHIEFNENSGVNRLAYAGSYTLSQVNNIPYSSYVTYPSCYVGRNAAAWAVPKIEESGDYRYRCIAPIGEITGTNHGKFNYAFDLDELDMIATQKKGVKDYYVSFRVVNSNNQMSNAVIYKIHTDGTSEQANWTVTKCSNNTSC